MIEIRQVSKDFDDIKAVNNVSINIENSKVFGLIGTNGAGKSTLLRIMAGVLKADAGDVAIDNEPVYENDLIKQNVFFMSDDQFYLPGATPKDMAIFYKSMYLKFDIDRFYEILNVFKLDPNRKINTFSKGIKKQLLVALGLSSKAQYLLCDEVFDGLDPVARQATKTIFINEIEKRQLTPVIASHNLRELEDICDNIGMIHQGGIVLNDSLDDMKIRLSKLQCVFRNITDIDLLKEKIEVINVSKRGSLYTITVRGSFEDCSNAVQELQPIFFEALQLSLEEIYISETEVMGYDIKDTAVQLS